MNTGIYAITAPSGKQYVGSATHFGKRWATHRYHLRRGTHHCPGLQHAYNKHGETALVFSKLLVCSVDNLLMYEQILLDAVPRATLYNANTTAGSMRGYRHSAETRARYSAVRRGVPKPRTAEHTQKIADARRGKALSAQARVNQSAAQKGRVKSAAHVAKVAAANRGKVRSEAHRAHVSAVQANRPTGKSASGYVGVSQVGSTWQARARINGERVYLGRFPTLEAAHGAVQAAIAEVG